MQNVFIKTTDSGMLKVAKINHSEADLTHVSEMSCSKDEMYLAAMWLSMAPSKTYKTQRFNAEFKELREEDAR